MTTYNEELQELMTILGLEEEPMGLYFSDQKPEKGHSPNPQTPVTREAEVQGKIDWDALDENFACVLSKIRRARMEGTAYFSEEQFGCAGGSFYMGYTNPCLNVQPHYVADGIPGILEGELYIKSHEDRLKLFDQFQPVAPKAKYLIVKSISKFQSDSFPDIVIFFANSEIIAGLSQLIWFITSDVDSVKTPFGAGCAGIISWPLQYMKEGKRQAVLGGMDPSSRIFFKQNEFSFAVPYSLFQSMINEWRSSFLTTKTWMKVQKRIARGKKK